MFALTFGHEFAAVVTVVATFLIGMALGGFFANAILLRLGRAAFSKLEFAVGILGLIAPFLILRIGANRLGIVAILPSTIAMGATLPAMARLERIPSAYAANTFGAVVGCLVTAFLLMPNLGFVTPSFIWAGCNFLAAFLSRRLTTNQPPPDSQLPARLAVTLFATGFLALAFETVGVRLLSLSLEDTVFTFAAILAVYLLGQSLGAALLQKINPLPWLGLAMAVSIFSFHKSGDLYTALRTGFGDSALAVAFAESLTALTLFLIPTFLMGALFGQLANRAGQGGVGKALLWNSIGAASGAALVPLILIPKFGAFFIFAGMAVGYLLWIERWHIGVFISGIATIVALIGAPRPLSLVRVPPAQALREVREGAMATVSVTETPDGNRTLFVNNHFQMGGTAATIPELRHADIPLLLHPNPHRALVIGLGTGITLSAAATFPDLKTDGVELLPEIIAVMPHFFSNPADSPLQAANISIHIADARRFVRESSNAYDVIVADLFHPAQEGSAFLYTREHFSRVRARLADEGLFCQWLPLHQLDLETFRDITRTFLLVFPNAEAWLLRPNIDAPVVALIGYKSNHPPFSSTLLDRRLSSPTLAKQLHRVALADPIRLFGSFLADSDSLRKFAGAGRINRDTFPVVMFEAPKFAYRHTAPTHERFMAFLKEVGSQTPPLDDPALAQKVRQYVIARDVYLTALVADSENNRAQAIDGYIESARLSEDFTLGYAQCLAIATAESRNSPTLAKSILSRLVEAQPSRPVAKEMLERLDRAH
jgi:spermidine synthase